MRTSRVAHHHHLDSQVAQALLLTALLEMPKQASHRRNKVSILALVEGILDFKVKAIRTTPLEDSAAINPSKVNKVNRAVSMVMVDSIRPMAAITSRVEVAGDRTMATRRATARHQPRVAPMLQQ